LLFSVLVQRGRKFYTEMMIQGMHEPIILSMALGLKIFEIWSLAAEGTPHAANAAH
jgi:hypothetical protein